MPNRGHFLPMLLIIFSNFVAIDCRTLKLETFIVLDVLILVMQLRRACCEFKRAWHDANVLPQPYFLTLEPLVIEG